MLLIPSDAVSIWGLGDARLAQKTQMTKLANRFLGTEDILPVLVIDQLKWKTTPYTSSIAIAMVFWPYPPQRNSKLALVSPFSVLCLYSFHPHPYLGQMHDLPKWFVWPKYGKNESATKIGLGMGEICTRLPYREPRRHLLVEKWLASKSCHNSHFAMVSKTWHQSDDAWSSIWL